MKNISLLLAILFASVTLAQEQNPTAVKYAETITVEDLKEDLTILASDALEGRETGKRGQKMAAAYIKAHFEELGLVGPVKNENTSSYYQNVPLKVSTPNDIYLMVNGQKLNHFKDAVLYYGENINTDEIQTEVVFAGNGSEASFNELDVKGKSVMVLVTNRGDRQLALARAREFGASFVFIVYHNSDEEYNQYKTRFETSFTRGRLVLDKEVVPSVRENAFFINPTIATEILGVSFEKMNKAIEDFNNGKQKALKKIKSKEVSYKLNFDTEKIISENVLGYLEGSDLKDELLVITSHYDHLGIHDGKIYNGADDDGSGTVAVMDIAEAFVKAKADGNGPRRSILFMTVTAEEKGLLGSEYYADNPIFPLENTVADLNLDMIGRIDDRELESTSYVSLVGADKLSSELHEISELMNSTYTNLFLDYTYNDVNHPERIYYRSDHWNFAKNGIPVIFYTTGSHPDYHQETDTVEKIEFELMRKRVQLVFYTAWEIVNRDGRLIVDKEPQTVGGR